LLRAPQVFCNHRGNEPAPVVPFCAWRLCSDIVFEEVMQPIISVQNVTKTYASGFQALRGVNLDIRQGEIFALLGPNGAGKTTLISVICGLVNPTGGRVLADGHD